jgi:hypothetical protein
MTLLTTVFAIIESLTQLDKKMSTIKHQVLNIHHRVQRLEVQMGDEYKLNEVQYKSNELITHKDQEIEQFK